MEKRLIYVTTGTCHFDFKRMLKLVEKCLSSIDGDNFEVILQYGRTGELVLRNQKSSNAFYSREESENYYKQSDIVFSHCGIGSIFNSLKYNTPTVIIPRLVKYEEFSDDHQLQIAKEIKRNPLILLLEDEQLDIENRFKQFYAKYLKHEKKAVDLINYGMANKVKEIILDL